MELKSWKSKFLIIYSGQAFSILGSAAVGFAIIWKLTIDTESAVILSLAMLFMFIPNAIFGPFAGVLIDRMNRKLVMILADGLVAITSVILGIAFLDGNASVGFIFFVLFLRGLGNTFHSPAMQATIPMLVPTDMLEKVGGWANLIDSTASMVGPVLGALLMNLLPIASIMVLDVVGATIAIVCLLFVHVPNVERDPEKDKGIIKSVLHDMKEGLLEVYHNKPLFKLSIPVLLSMLAYMPLAALFPLMIRTHFGGDAFHEGVVEFTFALGLMISYVVMGIFGNNKKTFLMISVSVVAMGLAATIGGGLPPALYVIFVGMSFVMGFAATFFSVPFMAFIQRTTSEENMGKVMSLMFTAMSLSTPVGLLVSGPISEAIGVNTWFMICGIIMVGCGFLCYFMTRGFKSDETSLSQTAIEEE